MQYFRHGFKGQEKPGLVAADGSHRDLSPHFPDFTPDRLSADALSACAAIDPQSLAPVAKDTRIGACVAQVSKIIGVGLNYRDHAEETGQPVPKEPVLFLKAISSLAGPYDDLLLPRGSVKTDWEVELGVIIGREASYVSEAEAFDYVAGYCVVNDVSEREYQFERGGNWSKGKSADGFAPIGPYFVPVGDVPDPQNLALFCDVNGERMQSGTTREMVFGVSALVSYISRFMRLLPGDVIATGTPAGVGFGRKPQRFLKAGDIVVTGIEGLGEQRLKIVASPHGAV